MTILMLLVGIVLAAVIVAGGFKIPGTAPKAAAGVAGLVVLLVFFTLSSVRYVGEDSVGIVVKNIGLRNLEQGAIIATGGEKGPQARTLPPGWHPWYWPGIYDIEDEQVIEIDQGQVGLITTTDGRPLPTGEIYAPEWPTDDFQQMLDAEHFLGPGGGYKGPQASVLTPGKYRLNTRLFRVETVAVTNVEQATVAVIKSNVGEMHEGEVAARGAQLVERGYRGIWRMPYPPQELYLNTQAYEVTMVSTKRNVVRYTALQSGGEEREISVRSSDGFTFPVDVRVEYEISPTDAPLVVASLGDGGEKLRELLNSSVRAIFRNNAEAVKALDYVQQRSIQESQSLAMLAEEMTKVGVTVTAVRIGDVGNEETLGSLLKTQTDREIAVQEQATFQEQQRAAEERKAERKALTRTEQEAEEERRLATAKYEVQIAEQDKEKKIIGANAEAEAIRIQAEAQSRAYQMIAEQIGPGNAALVELLKIVGERGINITPRVMVVGGPADGGGEPGAAETTALIGTMLDTMVAREAPAPRQAAAE
ncbi:MAG: SPFH domain-containing protein [Planctomycetota bacterium]|jgi:uncharacterized membrane protein YqiK